MHTLWAAIASKMSFQTCVLFSIVGNGEAMQSKPHQTSLIF